MTAKPQFRLTVCDEDGKQTTIQLPVRTEQQARDKARDLGFQVLAVQVPDADPNEPTPEAFAEAKSDDRLAIVFAVGGWIFLPLFIGAFVFAKRARAKSGGRLGREALLIARIGLGIVVICWIGILAVLSKAHS